MLDPLDWLGFSAFVIAIVTLGVTHVQRSQDFLVAGRRIGVLALVPTLVMTEFNTTTLLAFSGVGYRAGPMAVGLSAVFLVGLGWYTLAVARRWKRFDRMSVAELFTERYGRGVGRFASVLLIVAMVGFSATYVKSLTLIFAPWSGGLDPWVLSLGLTGLAVGLTIRGGLVSVIRTDVLGFCVTLAVIPALLGVAIYRHGGFADLATAFPPEQLTVNPVAQWNNPALPYWFVTSLVVITCFTYICSPWYGQKVFAAASERVAVLAVGISAVLVFVLYASAQLAAAFLRVEVSGLAAPETALPVMVGLWLPPFVRGVVYATLLVAAVTTLTGVWSAMVAMAVADFAPVRLAGVGRQRVATIAVAVLSWLGANLLVDDILNRLILANIPIAALSFALLAGFYWPQANTAGAWISIAVGVGWGVGCYLYFGDAGGYTWYWAIYGIPLIFGSGVVGSLLSARRPRGDLP
jgi:Na+/proline symporter